jgi:hypothetical protein
VVIQVRDDVFPALARLTTPEERAAIWDRFATAVPQYASHQKRVRRELPVVIVEPTRAPAR